MRYLIPILALWTFIPVNAGAADPEVIQISPDTYMITRDSKAGMFASMAKLKTKVINQANEFAASQGKIAIPISERTNRPNPGFPTYEYQFRLVDRDSPDSKSTAIESSPDQIIESRNKSSGEVTVRHESEAKPDLYTELLKLDDLRKKGILTDEEFEDQKRKLLEKN